MTEKHATATGLVPPAAKSAPPSVHAPAPLLAKLPTVLGLLLFVAALAVPVLLFADDRYWLPIITRSLAIAIFALSVDLVWGYTGLLSLGQGLYFGLGAYMVAYALNLQKAAQERGGAPGTALTDFMIACRVEEVPAWMAPLANIWLAVALAILLPTIVATLFGYVAFRVRIKGVFFSLITQAMTLAVFTFVVNQQPYTGGIVGMPGLARLELFGHRFNSQVEMYWLIAGSLVVCFALCLGLVRSKFGKVLTAIRDNETRTLALGYDTAMYKTFVFAAAGALAGFAGALYTAVQRTVGPEEVLGIGFSIEIVILVAVGGRGTLIGAVIGTLLVMLGKTYINNELKQAWPIILGGLFILVVVFLPEGIVGFLRHALVRLRKLWPRNRSLVVSPR
ncbi:MAG TPA: urea ABC transporter permease subunit UrtC [Gemmataceae bacterium]|nr:urea ABC transporter permease subunit UrtC [Gemmataceae bacterium]